MWAQRVGIKNTIWEWLKYDPILDKSYTSGLFALAPLWHGSVQIEPTSSLNVFMLFTCTFITCIHLYLYIIFRQSHRKEKELRSRDMKTIELYRSQNKREGILNMLNQAITTDHVLNVSFGTCEFFEFSLRNPYNTQHTVQVECDHPELL